MNDDNTSKTVHAFGSVFRWGSGLLGKSAIVVGFLVVGTLAIGFTLHSDLAKIGAIALAGVYFFVWYIRVMTFCDNHPAEAMLEGEQWAVHQQQITAKGQPPPPLDAPLEVAASPQSNITRIGDQR